MALVPARGHRGRRISSRFLLDVMLGRLSRYLRALGHNAAYDHKATDPELLARARRERRILVTRDTRLTTSARTPRIVLLHENDTSAQLRELVAALRITRHPGLFTRCIACNTRLRRARPEEIEDRAPEYVKATQRDFRFCPGCGRLFWPGTHRKGILEALEQALPGVTDPSSAKSALTDRKGNGRVRANPLPASPTREDRR